MLSNYGRRVAGKLTMAWLDEGWRPGEGRWLNSPRRGGRWLDDGSAGGQAGIGELCRAIVVVNEVAAIVGRVANLPAYMGRAF